MPGRLHDCANGNTDITSFANTTSGAPSTSSAWRSFGADVTFAFVEVARDDDAPELSAELVGDAALDHADDLIAHFADDPLPEKRVQARTNDARTLIETAPGRCCRPSSPQTSRAWGGGTKCRDT